VRLLVFTTVGLCAMVVAYALNTGGAVATLIFLFVLFNGVLDRVAQPLIQRFRP